jgi:hypothetical protein
MTASANAQAQSPQTMPVTTAADASDFAAHFTQIMTSLVDVIQEETTLVRAGRLSQAVALEPTKSELSRLYIADTIRLRTNREQLARFAPEVTQDLIRRHDEFRALLQINLTVLATAHAVSEGIVRGVSSELTRQATPQTYGASGRTRAPDPRNAAPLTVSRVL